MNLSVESTVELNEAHIQNVYLFGMIIQILTQKEQ